MTHRRFAPTRCPRRVRLVTHLILLLCVVALSGCATWSTALITPPKGASGAQAATTDDADTDVAVAGVTTEQTVAKPMTGPEKIILTEKDILDRPYKVLGDIEVTVNKTTIFHPNPTRELVAQKLREEAAKLRADAVILVRYGTLGIS